jgi:hypothetical protein
VKVNSIIVVIVVLLTLLVVGGSGAQAAPENYVYITGASGGACSGGTVMNDYYRIRGELSVDASHKTEIRIVEDLVVTTLGPFTFSGAIVSSNSPTTVPGYASVTILDLLDNVVMTARVDFDCTGVADGDPANVTITNEYEPPTPSSPSSTNAAPVLGVTVPNLGLAQISAGQAQPAYFAPLGGALTTGDDGLPLLLPTDADSNGFDTYVITGCVVDADGATWLSIFLGSNTAVYVPLDAVTILVSNGFEQACGE